MHKIIATIREIPAAELPTVRDIETGAERPATDAELLNVGLQRLAGDVFSCVEQYRSDHDDLVDEADGRLNRVWWHERDDSPWASEAEKRSYPRSAEECARHFGIGKLLTAGAAAARFKQLDEPVRRKVLRARVLRSGTVNVQETVAAALEGQKAAFLEHVGELRADLTSDRARLAEARRLAALPSTDIHAATVAMDEVLAGDDVVEEDGIIPHRWAGER